MESMELRIDKRNKYDIDEELYRIAKRVPYNLFIIKVANIYLSMADKLRKIPKDINIKKFSVKGYQNLPVPVELIESVNNNETLPAMLYIHGGAFSYHASLHHKELAYRYAKEVPAVSFSGLSLNSWIYISSSVT